ncbi:hypothetical protein VUR80DRAFT_6996 [Thermomyces stellatus]
MSSSSPMLVLQPKPVPRGTPDFEEKRAGLLRALADKVPASHRLPETFFQDPPTDVSAVPSTCGLLTPEELEITEQYDAVGLADAIARRKYTAVAVATAFSKRAIIAHQLTSCLTQWFPDAALEQARKLDAHLAEHGTPVGPLHGVPISIKDHMPIAGTSSSFGCLDTVVHDAEDCHMISILRRLGAVFYCKTNQPQTLMHLESDSLWGRVLNPYNTRLSAGGSTGGEAALIALRGSVLGVGTDIGGSIRGPSAFCGIYGFKPTSYTLPMKGFFPSPFAAELNVLCSTGPMCRSIRDMDLFMRVLLETRPHLRDPRLMPIPWTGLETSPGRPLRIGIMANDGFIEPQPPVKRALSWARRLLSDPRNVGHIELKPFTPHRAAKAWSILRRTYWPDGGALTRDPIVRTGEPLHPLSEWIWRDAEPGGMRTAEAVNAMRRERDDFRCAFAEDWERQGVDVVLGPAFVGPASEHDTAFYWTYTSLWNFVDYPGVVFPTPVRAEAGEKYDDGYVPLSDACRHVRELWDRGDFRGAPVDLQLVGRKYHDNQLFGALKLLEGVLGLA